MFLRALLVLLVMLNLGVAAWWATRAPASAPAAVAHPAGVPRLQLLGEATTGAPTAGATPAAMAGAPGGAAATAIGSTEAAGTCASFGPYDSAQEARAAAARLPAQPQRRRVREAVADTGAGWRVFLPPLADAAAAQAMAARLRAAGHDDLVVIGGGPDAHSIALGRFGSQARAQQRLAELRATGVQAQAAPVGNGPLRWWLDIAVAGTLDTAATTAALGARQGVTLDCATLP